MSENIWIAASDNDIAAVDAFLNAGQGVDAADENGYTALYVLLTICFLD